LQDLMRRGVGKHPGANPNYENGGEPKEKPAPKHPPVVPKPAWLAKAGPNLALAASVSVPDGELLHDGQANMTRNGERWLSQEDLPHVIEFAWEKPQTFGAARILSGFFDGAVIAPIRDFVLQWQDGAEWRDVSGTAVQENRDPFWATQFSPVTATKLRLVVTRTKNDTSRIWEVEFFGPPS
jgi:hypothetical protein